MSSEPGEIPISVNFPTSKASHGPAKTPGQVVNLLVILIGFWDRPAFFFDVFPELRWYQIWADFRDLIYPPLVGTFNIRRLLPRSGQTFYHLSSLEGRGCPCAGLQRVHRPGLCYSHLPAEGNQSLLLGTSTDTYIETLLLQSAILPGPVGMLPARSICSALDMAGRHLLSDGRVERSSHVSGIWHADDISLVLSPPSQGGIP